MEQKMTDIIPFSIAVSSFEYNTRNIKHFIHNPQNLKPYVRHDVELSNFISCKSNSFKAVYNTGQSFLGNDYLAPSPNIELSDNDDTDGVLIIVNRLYESDFESDDSTLIDEALDELEETYNLVLTKDELCSLYYTLMDNHNYVDHFLRDEFDFSDNPSDYVIDPSTGYAILNNGKPSK